MKRAIIDRLALVTIALALSLIVFTRDGMRNVSPCDMTPGCVTANQSIIGTFITTRQGFPVAYKVTQTFQPTKGASYKQASLTQQGVDAAAIALDVLFWFALLELLRRIRSTILDKYRPAPQAAAADTESQAVANDVQKTRR